MIVQTKNTDLVQPLFERYIWHMKQYHEINDVTAWKEGAYQYFNLYASEPERKLYYTSTSEEEIFGFAMLNNIYRFNSTGTVVAEFYIAPDMTGQGHGKALAEYVFSSHPGEWEVSVMSANAVGLKFWEKVISKYTNGKFTIQTKDSYDGKGFIFNNV